MTPKRILLTLFLVAGVVVTYVFGKVEGGFLAWFLFSFALVLSFYEGITGFVGLRQVSAQRRLSATRLSAGQTLTVSVHVKRRGPWPLVWLRLRDELPKRLALQVQGGERVLLPLWTRELEYTYQIPRLSRGIYVMGDTVMESGDLLGILSLSRHATHHDTLVVYPQVAPVRGWGALQPEELGQREATRRRSDESTNVLGVREYVPGDRLSRIHWRATARRGQLLAKEFEMHVSSELLFIPDLSKESYRGMSGDVFELTMTVVASLMKHAYERHRKFGMTLAGEKAQRFPAGADEALFLRCMEALAMASPNSPTSFGETLQRVAQEAPMGTLLVVVSPKLDRAAVVSVEGIRRRTPLEWFAPVVQNEFTATQLQSLDWLASMRIPVHPVRSAAGLAQLKRGGGPVAPNANTRASFNASSHGNTGVQ